MMSNQVCIHLYVYIYIYLTCLVRSDNEARSDGGKHPYYLKMRPYFLDDQNHKILNLQNPNVLHMLYHMNQTGLKDCNDGYNWMWLLESMGYTLDDETIEMGKTWPRVQEGVIIVSCCTYRFEVTSDIEVRFKKDELTEVLENKEYPGTVQ